MLPQFNVPVFFTKLDEETRIGLLDLINEKTEEILSLPCNNPERDKNWLTSRLWKYNLLQFESKHTKNLKKFITESYKGYASSLHIDIEEVYCQCWANRVVNDGRPITLHTHTEAHGGAPEVYSYISGNICIQAENTSTFYKSPFTSEMIGIENEYGVLTLFPSYVPHCTSVNKSEKPRISIAFDLINTNVYNMLQNTNYVKL